MKNRLKFGMKISGILFTTDTGKCAVIFIVNFSMLWHGETENGQRGVEQMWHIKTVFKVKIQTHFVRHVTGNDKDYLRKIPRVVW